MAAYFVDTWFFIAYMDEADPHHRTARRLARSLNSLAIVTHDAVLGELLTFFAGHDTFWRRTAATLARNVLIDPRYEVHPMGRQLFLRALSMYERRPDKEYSLVDCASMVLMRERGITHVL